MQFMNILVQAKKIKTTADGALVTTPEMIKGTFTPSSPVQIDMTGRFFSSLALKGAGAMHMEYFRSVNSPDPVNQDAIDAAIAAGTAIPAMDLSNVEWKYVGEEFIEHAPFHFVRQDIVGAINRSRYVQINLVRGGPLQEVYPYGT